jgi:hypothetical protein
MFRNCLGAIPSDARVRRPRLWHRDVEAPVAGSARDASRERAALAVEEAASPRETFEPSLTFGDPHIPNMHNS